MSSKFDYQAIDRQGKSVTGTTEGNDRVSVLNALSAEGLQVFKLDEARAQSTSIWSRDLFSPDQVKPAEIAQFLRILATLVSAKLPIDKALSSVAGEGDSKALQALSSRLRDKVQSGRSLADAMAEEEGLPPSLAAMVSAGEQSGSLAKVLEACATDQVRRVALSGQVRSALIYPFLLGVMALLSLIFIITILLPALQPLIEETGGQFPEPARSLHALGTSIQSAPVLWGGAAAAMIAGLFMLFSDARFRERLDRWALNAPIIGPLIRDTQSRTICSLLGLTLEHKVQPLRAVEIAKSVTRNGVFKSGLEKAGEDLKAGRSISVSFADHVPLQSQLTELIAAGERSGTLAEMFTHAGEIANEQAKRSIERLVGLVTPATTIILGLLIGGLVLSVMTALMSANDAVL
ncbi:MAG: type II secretion system F family protein [Pseudomonadota bacterium]